MAMNLRRKIGGVIPVWAVVAALIGSVAGVGTLLSNIYMERNEATGPSLTVSASNLGGGHPIGSPFGFTVTAKNNKPEEVIFHLHFYVAWDYSVPPSCGSTTNPVVPADLMIWVQGFTANTAQGCTGPLIITFPQGQYTVLNFESGGCPGFRVDARGTATIQTSVQFNTVGNYSWFISADKGANCY